MIRIGESLAMLKAPCFVKQTKPSIFATINELKTIRNFFTV